MMKKLDYEVNNYKIEILRLSKEDGGGYLASAPKLPGCISDGETQEEALINIKDAIKCWIETAREIGREVPQEDEYKTENDYSGKLSLRIPKTLHRQVSDMAEKEGCSINQLIMMYISLGIGNDLGKKQVNVTYYKQNNEIPIIDRMERETWETYGRNSNLSNQ